MPPTKDYEIPTWGSKPDRVLGWCLDAEAEGRAWLETQRPTQEWANALQVLASPDTGDVVDGLSNLGYNKAKRVARELVASLANFRHEGEFKVRWDNKLYDQAHTLSDLDRNWYRETKANLIHRAGLQYAIGLGTTYFMQTWDKNFHAPFKGDIKLQALSPQDVYFVQLPKDGNIQRAYAVIIREELPINLAKAIYGADYPQFAASLVPDRDQPGWLEKGLQKVQQFLAPALRVAGTKPNQQRGSFPTVDIFHMYTMDASVNEGSAPIRMGMPGTNWSYMVPALGDPVPTGVRNPETGNFFTVPATREHSRLFPLRRYTIYSRTALAYDNSSPYWHGKAPLTRLSFGDWAWEALGSSQVAELKSMQDGIIALMRGIEDSAAARLDPALQYDDRMGDTWQQAFNPRKAGARAKVPMAELGGTPISPVLPAEYYNVPQWITGWIEAQEARMDYLSGVRDLVAITKANQIPGADTLEKLMEMAGPIVEDLVRRVEEPLHELGEQRKSMYFQFYTRQRMITTTGPDGVDVDRQYTSDMLIPSLAGESEDMRTARARAYLHDFRYHVTESGINEIHRLSNKLLYIQLSKAGFPISWWTIAKVCQIPNFGPPPEGTNTELERWIAQKRIETDLAMDQQEEVAMRTAALGGGGAPDDGSGGGGEGTQPPPGGGAPEGGRPASFQKAPRLVSKDQGARSTITTS